MTADPVLFATSQYLLCFLISLLRLAQESQLSVPKQVVLGPLCHLEAGDRDARPGSGAPCCCFSPLEHFDFMDITAGTLSSFPPSP